MMMMMMMMNLISNPPLLFFQLRFEPRPDRKLLAPQLISETPIPPCAYIPMCKSTEKWTRVTRILPKEARVFSTKERCPILMCFACQYEEEYVDVATYLHNNFEQDHLSEDDDDDKDRTDDPDADADADASVKITSNSNNPKSGKEDKIDSIKSPNHTSPEHPPLPPPITSSSSSSSKKQTTSTPIKTKRVLGSRKLFNTISSMKAKANRTIRSPSYEVRSTPPHPPSPRSPKVTRNLWKTQQTTSNAHDSDSDNSDNSENENDNSVDGGRRSNSGSGSGSGLPSVSSKSSRKSRRKSHKTKLSKFMKDMPTVRMPKKLVSMKSKTKFKVREIYEPL